MEPKSGESKIRDLGNKVLSSLKKLFFEKKPPIRFPLENTGNSPIIYEGVISNTKALKTFRKHNLVSLWTMEFTQKI